ncbi:hypothetical protein SODALDRAFT_222647 [Sodiomyces alkalinus F11]|uniref:Uncharacterized protein n=1 Tax=Sodiomyces alkalinus (strain CBS 110278 / VKM F-3762 / F11) TaxID=1314773 RepID=A0A3N2PQ75_SODAK|nr:hypothetical protein SODALDRAFT_222647 [Sodiomyces alkalinus F11]ROT36580.1 hypothetical protein SODALDRAFT_222647 [Sodiomyces alkalinus F11]
MALTNMSIDTVWRPCPQGCLHLCRQRWPEGHLRRLGRRRVRYHPPRRCAWLLRLPISAAATAAGLGDPIPIFPQQKLAVQSQSHCRRSVFTTHASESCIPYITSVIGRRRPLGGIQVLHG